MAMEIKDLNPTQAYSLAFTSYHLSNNNDLKKFSYDELAEIIISGDKMDLVLNWLRCIPFNEDMMVNKLCQVSNKTDGAVLFAALELPLAHKNIIKIKYKIIDVFPNVEDIENRIKWMENYLTLEKFYQDLPPEVQLGVKL